MKVEDRLRSAAAQERVQRPHICIAARFEGRRCTGVELMRVDREAYTGPAVIEVWERPLLGRIWRFLTGRC